MRHYGKNIDSHSGGVFFPVAQARQGAWRKYSVAEWLNTHNSDKYPQTLWSKFSTALGI